MSKFVLWFLRVFSWLFFRLRIYYKISKTYQRLQLRWPLLVLQLPQFDNLQDLETVLGKMKWRKDTVFQWFDTFEHPKVIWEKYQLDPEKGVEDCDGFAIFAADRLRDMMRRGVRIGDNRKILGVYVMTVTWMKSSSSIAGHNVCLVKYYDPNLDTIKFGNIGNWFHGKFWDGFDNPWDIACAVTSGKDLVQCAIATPRLRLIANGWTEASISSVR
jgi:hypothetical protein